MKTLKLRPPNRGNKWRHVRRLMSLRDNLYNQGCITRRQIDIYSVLIRETLSGSLKTWIQRSVALIVKRVRRIARRRGKQPLVLIDAPDYESIRGTPLQRTLYSFKKHLENILSWYGVYWEEVRLYSTRCPFCGGRMKLAEKTRRRRIVECNECGFREDRDNIPLYWALKHLSVLKGRSFQL